MRKEYTAPELKTVGQADQVVLGSFVTGVDILNEFLVGDSEFQPDHD